MKPTGRQKIDIASRAAVGLSSVRRYLAGESLRETTLVHIERALVEMNLTHFSRANAGKKAA
jgi:hypothetical protein